jgi:hypothetical protein
MVNLDFDLCLRRGVDSSLAINLDSLIESNGDIRNVYKEEKTFTIGPNGGRPGIAVLDITMMFNTSEPTIKGISHCNDISKEEFAELIKDLKKELGHTHPKLSICRFWAQKIVQ